MYHADIGIRQAKAQLISEQLPIEEAPDMDLVVAARRRHCEKKTRTGGTVRCGRGLVRFSARKSSFQPRQNPSRI